MSIYAYVYNNQIIEFKEIDDTLYQSWVNSNNPKKNSYLIVNYTTAPKVSSTEIAESSYEIQ